MPSELARTFSNFAGKMAESLSFNRSIGQIYGLLYMSEEPLSLDDISRQLSMSKGNASINLRELEGWGAVRSVYVNGSRRDYYEANRNVREIALRRLQEGMDKRLNLAGGNLDQLLEQIGASANGEAKKRVKELRSLVSRCQTALRMLPKVLPLILK